MQVEKDQKKKKTQITVSPVVLTNGFWKLHIYTYSKERKRESLRVLFVIVDDCVRVALACRACAHFSLHKWIGVFVCVFLYRCPRAICHFTLPESPASDALHKKTSHKLIDNNKFYFINVWLFAPLRVSHFQQQFKFQFFSLISLHVPNVCFFLCLRLNYDI